MKKFPLSGVPPVANPNEREDWERLRSSDDWGVIAMCVWNPPQAVEAKAPLVQFLVLHAGKHLLYVNAETFDIDRYFDMSGWLCLVESHDSRRRTTHFDARIGDISLLWRAMDGDTEALDAVARRLSVQSG